MASLSQVVVRVSTTCRQYTLLQLMLLRNVLPKKVRFPPTSSTIPAFHCFSRG